MIVISMAAASAKTATASGTASAGASVSRVTSSVCLPEDAHEDSDVFAVCAALNLDMLDNYGYLSEAVLLDRLLEAVRDIPSLMKRHSRDELVGACKVLGLLCGGNKTVLSTRLHEHLMKQIPTAVEAVHVSADDSDRGSATASASGAGISEAQPNASGLLPSATALLVPVPAARSNTTLYAIYAPNCTVAASKCEHISTGIVYLGYCTVVLPCHGLNQPFCTTPLY